MVRFLVAFLVGLPLLMPPGVCICQFLPCAKAAANNTRLPATRKVTPVLSEGRSSCNCHRHRVSVTIETANDGGDVTSTSAKQSDPLPNDRHQHAPGCPAAVQSADKSHFTGTPRLMLKDVTGVMALLPLLVHRPGTVQSRPTISHRSADSPIFLTFCTLVI